MYWQIGRENYITCVQKMCIEQNHVTQYKHITQARNVGNLDNFNDCFANNQVEIRMANEYCPFYKIDITSKKVALVSYYCGF